MNTALLDRADFAARLCEAVADWTIAGRPEWTVEDEYDTLGVQAYILRLASGEHWLVIPGTGYAPQGHPAERYSDWWLNLRSAFAWPKAGPTGRYWWPWGFGEAALMLGDWLGDREIAFAVGYSQGGGIVQPLACWRESIQEAHAIATPKGVYSPSWPGCHRLHCWIADDDLVTWQPLLARHAGRDWRLTANSRQHTLRSYRERIAYLRAAVAATERRDALAEAFQR